MLTKSPSLDQCNHLGEFLLFPSSVSASSSDLKHWIHSYFYIFFSLALGSSTCSHSLLYQIIYKINRSHLIIIIKITSRLILDTVLWCMYCIGLWVFLFFFFFFFFGVKFRVDVFLLLYFFMPNLLNFCPHTFKLFNLYQMFFIFF